MGPRQIKIKRRRLCTCGRQGRSGSTVKDERKRLVTDNLTLDQPFELPLNSMSLERALISVWKIMLSDERYEGQTRDV